MIWSGLRPASSALSAAGRSGELIASVISLGICAAGTDALSATLAATGASGLCTRDGSEIHETAANAAIVDRTNRQVPIRILIALSILRVTFYSSSTSDS